MTTIITISGLPGSGTSTAARLLAERTGMKMISSGEVFRELAVERGLSLEEFSGIAETDENIDAELDAGLLKKVGPGCILEGRLTGHLLHREGIDSLKVWLKAPLEVRVQRIAQREDDDEVHEKTVKRERSEFQRYKKYYGIDLDDMSVYDMVIDSRDNLPEDIVDKITRRLEDETCEGEGLHRL